MRRKVLGLALLLGACAKTEPPANQLQPYIEAPEPPECSAETDCGALGAGAGCIGGHCVPADQNEAPSWEVTSGPRGFGEAIDLAVDGETFVVSGYSVVQVSRDGGRSWSSAAPLPQLRQDDVVVMGNTILVRNADNQLFRSLDLGAHWSELPPVAGLIRWGHEVWASRFDPDTGEVSTDYTTDLINWTHFADTPFSLSPGEGLVLGVALEGGVFLSEDRGATWSPIEVPLRISGGPFWIWGDTILSMADEQEGLVTWASHDRGQTWEITGLIETPPNSADTMAQTPDGLFFVSSRGGLDWLADPNGSWVNLIDGNVNGLNARGGFGGPEGLFRIYKGELQKWDAADRTFRQHGTAPPRTVVGELAVDGSTVYASVDGNRISRSDDGGRTWTTCNEPTENPGMPLLGYDDIRSLAARDGSVWVGTAWYGIFRSDDGCNSWTPVGRQLPRYGSVVGEAPRSAIDLLATDDGLFVCTGGVEQVPGSEGGRMPTSVGVWRSVDGGATWSAARSGIEVIGSNLEGPLYDPCSAIYEQDGNLFLSTVQGLYRSTNGGTNWEPIESAPRAGNFAAPLVDLIRDGDRLLGAFVGTTGSGLFQSLDDGASWSDAGIELPDGAQASALVQAGSKLVVLSSRTVGVDLLQAVIASEDGGTSWAPFGEGDPLGVVTGLDLFSTGDELLLPLFEDGVRRLPLDRLR